MIHYVYATWSLDSVITAKQDADRSVTLTANSVMQQCNGNKW